MKSGLGVSSFVGSAVSILLVLSFPAWVRAQVDCVWPATIHLSRVVGRVVDPFGAPIPDVQVSLNDADRVVGTVRTDAQGAFTLKVPAGKYQMRAELKLFAPLQVDLEVGQDVVHVVHSSFLNVILGLRGSFCSWATTSKSEFQNEINSNKKRSSGNKENNATQK